MVGVKRGMAVILAEQHEIQKKLQKIERQQRRSARRSSRPKTRLWRSATQLIDSLESRLAQRTDTETHFTIRWAVT